MRRRESWQYRLFRKSKWKCYFCGVDIHKRDSRCKFYATVDHLVPRSRGGMTVDTNVVAACRSCNHKKGNMTEEEFRGTGEQYGKLVLFVGERVFCNRDHYQYGLTPLTKNTLPE